MRHKYNKDQVIAAVKNSISIREVLKKLGIVPAGGNYQTIKKFIAEFNIDISNLVGQGWAKGKTPHNFNSRPLSVILVYGKYESSHDLKNRLLRAGVKSRKCDGCFLTEWCNKPIPLELHHKDGDRKNHLIDNLALLCPNCHALTNNYRGKAKTNG